MNSIDGKSVQRGEPSAGSTREADVGMVAGFRIGICRLPPSGAGDASRKGSLTGGQRTTHALNTATRPQDPD